jgi:hypothetical protein
MAEFELVTGITVADDLRMRGYEVPDDAPRTEGLFSEGKLRCRV